METIFSYIVKSKETLLEALFPSLCVGCGKEGRYVCDRCTLFLTEAEPVCPRCFKQSVTGEVHGECKRSEGLDGLVCVWEHEGLMKSLLRTITEAGVTHAVAETVELAFGRLIDERERYAPFFHALLASNAALTFVPRFPKTERKRGFNQAALIAKALGRIAEKKPERLLRKLREVSFSASWDRASRRTALEKAFSLEISSRGNLPRRAILVDDVMVSGVTMQECAALLKLNGVEEVWGFTLARTP